MLSYNRTKVSSVLFLFLFGIKENFGANKLPSSDENLSLLKIFKKTSSNGKKYESIDNYEYFESLPFKSNFFFQFVYCFDENKKAILISSPLNEHIYADSHKKNFKKVISDDDFTLFMYGKKVQKSDHIMSHIFSKRSNIFTNSENTFGIYVDYRPCLVYLDKPLSYAKYLEVESNHNNYKDPQSIKSSNLFFKKKIEPIEGGKQFELNNKNASREIFNLIQRNKNIFFSSVEDFTDSGEIECYYVNRHSNISISKFIDLNDSLSKFEKEVKDIPGSVSNNFLYLNGRKCHKDSKLGSLSRKVHPLIFTELQSTFGISIDKKLFSVRTTIDLNNSIFKKYFEGQKALYIGKKKIIRSKTNLLKIVKNNGTCSFTTFKTFDITIDNIKSSIDLNAHLNDSSLASYFKNGESLYIGKEKVEKDDSRTLLQITQDNKTSSFVTSKFLFSITIDGVKFFVNRDVTKLADPSLASYFKNGESLYIGKEKVEKDDSRTLLQITQDNKTSSFVTLNHLFSITIDGTKIFLDESAKLADSLFDEYFKENEYLYIEWVGIKKDDERSVLDITKKHRKNTFKSYPYGYLDKTNNNMYNIGNFVFIENSLGEFTRVEFSHSLSSIKERLDLKGELKKIGIDKETTLYINGNEAKEDDFIYIISNARAFYLFTKSAKKFGITIDGEPICIDIDTRLSDPDFEKYFLKGGLSIGGEKINKANECTLLDIVKYKGICSFDTFNTDEATESDNTLKDKNSIKNNNSNDTYEAPKSDTISKDDNTKQEFLELKSSLIAFKKEALIGGIFFLLAGVVVGVTLYFVKHYDKKIKK